MPDLAFVSVDCLPGRQVPTEPVPDLSPDLAVEVLSPSNTRREIDRKLQEYFGSGTRMVWIIDPAKRTVAAYRQPEEPEETISQPGTLHGRDVLKEFTVTLDDLFEFSL